MSSLPLILRAAKLREPTNSAFTIDTPTSEEPLAATLETGPSGYILARETKLTEVGRETTDDN